MDTSPTTFDFGSKQLRTLMVEGQPWFVAADVCRALGLSNTTKALLALDADDKGLNSIQTLGGPQKLNTISEPGLYRLVLRSDTPRAKACQDWVTRDVLPPQGRDVRGRGGKGRDRGQGGGR